MNNNLLCLFVAIALLAISALTAQPVTGLPLPSAPSDNEARLKEQDFTAKAAQARTAELGYESAQLALMQSRLLQSGIPKLIPTARESALQKRAYPGFLVGFSAEHSQPQWSYHAIGRDIFQICLNREEAFFEDLSLIGAARLSQYKSSGFQRGHMAPAADFRWSPRASVASNILTNIAPQSADLNEGLWASLEISVRHYLEVRDSLDQLLVVTGPVLENGLKKLKDTTRVSIPQKFFKVVANLKEQQGFAFLMETSAPDVEFKKVESELRKRAMSIDSLEKILQIDFFPNFSAVQNRNIESKFDIDDWFGIPGKSLGNIPAPITDANLLLNAFNPTMLTRENHKDKKAVVGTVTRVSVGQSGGVVLFLDNLPPNHRFQVLVQSRDADKFKNPLLNSMLGRVVRAEGTISAIGDQFRISVRDPKKLIVLL